MAISTETAVEERKVLFKPWPGPQWEFLRSSAYEVLFGGAKGPGKSACLVMAACQYALDPKLFNTPPGKIWDPSKSKSLILRRTYPQLEDLIIKSRQWYPSLGATFNKSDHIWTFPSGGFVKFGYLDCDDDTNRYQGHEYDFIGWDELTHWPTPYCYTTMQGCLRGGDPNIPKRNRATANPGGFGHKWVMQHFGIPPDGCQDGKPIEQSIWHEETKSYTRRVFIPARLKDNPTLAKTSYANVFSTMTDAQKAALRDGRWDVLDGNMFTDFKPSIHTCPRFMIPASWTRWRGGDDGYSEPACILWFARDPRTGIKYVYQELYRSGLTAEKLAEKILELDQEGICSDSDPNEVVKGETLSGIMDDGAFKAAGIETRAGEGRGQIMNNLGCRWDKAIKGPGSRVAGVNLFHQHLTLDPATPEFPNGKPRLVIFHNCRNLIEQLPAMVIDPHNREDVIEGGEDHAYDSARYGLQKSFGGGSGAIRIRGI